MIKYFFLFLILSLFACSSVKDGLTLKKKNNVDEFLVEKKNPLIMPPDFEELPEPITNKSSQEIKETNASDEIEKLLSNEDKISSKNGQSKPSSVEKSILQKIK